MKVYLEKEDVEITKDGLRIKRGIIIKGGDTVTFPQVTILVTETDLKKYEDSIKQVSKIVKEKESRKGKRGKQIYKIFRSNCNSILTNDMILELYREQYHEDYKRASLVYQVNELVKKGLVKRIGRGKYQYSFKAVSFHEEGKTHQIIEKDNKNFQSIEKKEMGLLKIRKNKEGKFLRGELQRILIYYVKQHKGEVIMEYDIVDYINSYNTPFLKTALYNSYKMLIKSDMLEKLNRGTYKCL